jgi:ribosomal protein, L4/L1 family
LYLSARNIKKVSILNSREINVYSLIKQDKVIVTKEALATIEEVLA